MNWFSHWDEWLEYLDSNGVKLEKVTDEDGKKVLSFAYKKVTEDEIDELFKD